MGSAGVTGATCARRSWGSGVSKSTRLPDRTHDRRGNADHPVCTAAALQAYTDKAEISEMVESFLGKPGVVAIQDHPVKSLIHPRMQERWMTSWWSS